MQRGDEALRDEVAGINVEDFEDSHERPGQGGQLDSLVRSHRVATGRRLGQSMLRPGERVDVYEHGFTHVTNRATRPFRWEQVAGPHRAGRYRDSGLQHSLGVDLRCVVVLRDGAKVKFNTLTEDADFLARTIDTNKT